MRAAVDLGGQKFGRLSVICRDGARNGAACWACACDCGNTVTARGSDLRSGKQQSCGCLGREARLAAHITHNQTGTRLYNIWQLMRRRCENADSQDWPNYGGRGIQVCAEWLSFEKFHRWAISNGYAEHLTIDRRDNDGPYEPSNCQWITKKAQASNRRDRWRNHVKKGLAA